MTWITTCTAPDLSSLGPLVANYNLNVALTNRGGSDDAQVRSYVHSYLVTTDKAVRAYNQGRALLLEYVASSNRSSLLRNGLGDFETCITAIKRNLRLVPRMGNHPENPDIERSQKRLIASFDAEITRVRDAIEHMDEVIFDGKAAGVPALLAVSQDGAVLQIASHQLPFTRLAECLSEVHALGLALASRER